MRALAVATVLLAAASADADPLVLARGDVLARLSIEANIQTKRFARPLSFAPDLWIGVTDRVTVGLIHSSQSVDRIESGATFCVRELASRCERAYHGSGLDLRYAWTPGVALRTRLLLRDVDPMKPAVAVGALVRGTRGRFSLPADPYLRIGLANRDTGNRDTLVVPVWLGAQLGSVVVAVHTGIDGDLAVWRDGWHIPVAVVVEVAPARAITLGVEAGYPSLLGPQNSGDRKTVIIYAAARL
ncbi:hypothetical protein BH11MYX3_BH11MYX3_40740 [soil metagenome]